jgi:hypothetical protein
MNLLLNKIEISKMKGLKSMIILITVFAFNQLTAQDIKEMVLPMSDGDKNALVLTLPKTDAKEVEKTWQKFIKDYDGKTKKNKKQAKFLRIMHLSKR